MSDPNLVVRLLREQREEMMAFRAEFQQFREETRAEFRAVKGRLGTLEHTLSGMASHLFALTGMVKDHDRRIRKLESRSK